MSSRRPLLPPPYPENLEAFWLGQARRTTGKAKEADVLDFLQEAVQSLSDYFTGERPEEFGDYFNHAPLRAAYGLFYFPRSFARVRVLLEEMWHLRGWRPPVGGPLRVLDLGAGPGAATAALLHFLEGCHRAGEGGPWQVEVTAVDHSPDALAAMAEWVGNTAFAGVTASLRSHRANLRRVSEPPGGSGGFDLALAAFALNEAFAPGEGADTLAGWLAEVQVRMAPGGLLLILEPALAGAAERLESLRDRLFANGQEATAEAGGWHLWEPCLHTRSCPLLAEGRYFCHEVRTWEPPQTLEYLNRRLFRSVRDLKFSFVALGVSGSQTSFAGPEAGERAFRLISPLTAMKGHLLVRGCAAEGRVCTYEIPTRGLRKAEVKAAAAAIQRGDCLELSEPVPVGESGRLRVSGLGSIQRHFSPIRPEDP